MPCKCLGVHSEKCRCTLRSPVYPVAMTNGQVMILTQRDSTYYNRTVASRSTSGRPLKQNFALTAINAIYEKCAGYNLRHCPLRRAGGCCSWAELLKDLTNVTFFVLTNTVVFAAILYRMTFDAALAIVGAARWIKRSIGSVVVEKGDPRPVYHSSFGKREIAYTR